ncbi:hypothetical protein [Bacillus thuringiensis]|uniref:hypothetical protein n=1 Tax=Bacillus thuringiensis TaxID=1428 RepID=UPI0021D64B30|nr:hypothetical protein [Bacillus thuringiensis]MCU7666835.1 hypothetical protein [Bacillus thuringiensis]
MFGSAKGLEIEFFEEKSITVLKTKVNEYLRSLSMRPTEILDIKYHSDREEYGKHFTAMIIFRNL